MISRLARRVVVIAFMLVAAMLAPSVGHAQARTTATWQPAPKWIEELSPDLTTPVDPSAVHHGVYDLLLDTRVRLSEHNVEKYSRWVEKATNQAGVAELGEVELEYSPTYQKLFLHRAAVIRDGHVLDQTGRASLRLIEQERDSAHRMYSGSVTALLVLSDVRAGDVIDVAYSVVGTNPVLGGRYAGHLRLGTGSQARRVHVEIQSQGRPAPLHYHVRGSAPAPAEQEIAGNRVITWDLKEVHPEPEEDRIPSDVSIPAEVEVSEFADWADVVAWAQSMYPPAPSAALTEKARELRSSTKDLSEAVLAAIRFVQDDVRYLSISLGPHSVQPHAPASVLAQRFGDCKDKSYLLVELLRALGVEAHEALADTDLKAHLRDSLPSPYAFDHAIIALEFGGERHWIDATWSHQGGTLETVVAPDLGAALLIAPGTTELSNIALPVAPEPTIWVTNDYRVAVSGSAELTVVSTYRGTDADAERSELASRSVADLSHDFLNFYEKPFPGVTTAQPLEIKDDRSADVITIAESYSLPSFWREGARTLDPELLWGYLEPPKAERRETPLHLSHPVWLRETHRVALPFAPGFAGSEKTYTDGTFELERQIAVDGKTVTATHEYKSLAEAVPLEGVAKHLKLLTQARHEVGLDLSEESTEENAATVENTEAPPAIKHEPPGPPSYVLLIELGVGLVLGVGFLVYSVRRNNRKKSFRKQRDGKSGDLPANPAVVTSLTRAREALVGERCSCGSALPESGVSFVELWYEGEPLGAGRVTCEHCGVMRRGYYRLEGERGDDARDDTEVAPAGDPES